MEKGISYLNRTFNDYRNSLLNYTKQYYPGLDDEFNDASIGSWLLDVVANVGDNLSYHIDRVYQETNIDSARERASIYALARNKGVKIPGPKASIAEITFSCELPTSTAKRGGLVMDSPDWTYAPIIKKGTKISAGSQVFELMYDVDFAEQFNEDGISNRTFIPKRNSNGFITKYIVSKTGIVMAGETKVFSKAITPFDITPFMSFIIPDTNVTEIESIIVKDGLTHYKAPELNEFLIQDEISTSTNECGDINKTWRFFEVDYLAQQYRWGDYHNDGNVEIYERPSDDGTTNEYSIRRGAWLPLRQKFLTEYTDKGFIKVTFGAGNMYNNPETDNNTLSDYKNTVSHIINNDGLGVLPPHNTTMFVMYRKGGGASSNLAEGVLNNISFLNADFRGADSNVIGEVRRTLGIKNSSPSVSGRDMLSVEELKNYIKYNNGAQERCVTIKDYHDRIAKMPARYGTPFKYGVTEENNKVMIYLLGLDSNGNLTMTLPNILTENLQNYLSEYRMINDYIEIKSGRIINLQFEVDVYVDKNYVISDVISNIISCIQTYMNKNKLQMGDDIFVGDIEKEISKLDGVLNLIELRVYNIFGPGYSNHKTTQEIKNFYEDCDNPEDVFNSDGSFENRNRINLYASDKMLYTENDTIFEVRYPEQDIICKVKTR